MTPRRVVIVGAGITGLAAAYYLEKRARERNLPVHCTLVEAGKQPGGKIVTESLRDFVIEGGPDSFVTDKPWCLSLCHELGLADSLIPSNQTDNKIYMLRKGRLTQFPTGFRLSIPTRIKPFLLTPLISPWGKMRMALEYVLPPRPSPDDESLGHFIGRRFGREAVETFGGPLMAGIFVSDPDRLSMRGSFPTFLEMEKKYGSLIRAARMMKKKPPAKRAGPAAAGGAMFNSVRGGMFELVEALRKNITADLLLGASVVSIARKDKGYAIHVDGRERRTIEADDVVLTVPAHRAAALLLPLHENLSAALGRIRFVSTATVSLAYRREDLPADRPLDGFGVLIPASENRRIIASTWASTKFAHRAPPGSVLLRAFVGGYRGEALAEQSEEELAAMVREEFDALFGLRAAPSIARVYRWPKGNPQYDVGHLDRVGDMEAMTGDLPGMHLAGSSYHGVGMPDCIKSALRAVDRILP
jgi:oxygen-dependent protoporphyrinogen oxidase